MLMEDNAHRSMGWGGNGPSPGDFLHFLRGEGENGCSLAGLDCNILDVFQDDFICI